MAADPDPTTPEGAAAVLDELADRADTPPPRATAATPAGRALDELDAIRQHLHAAHLRQGAGTLIPGDARLRQVKRAVNLGLRPVTSHQVPFNQDVVAAIGRLVDVVEELVEAVGRSDERAHQVVARAAAGIATVEVGQADVEDELARLADLVDELVARTTAAEEGLAAQRQAAGAARVREAAVLRAARATLEAEPSSPGTAGPTGGGDPADTSERLRTGVGPLSRALDDVEVELRDRLAAVGRAEPDELRAQAEAVAEVVVEAAGAAPVLDLASGRGEWLDAWAARGLDVTGVEADPEAGAALGTRGHTVATSAPLPHLAAVAAGSCGAVTAALLADVVDLADLVALLDGAVLALRPGGVLVLSAAGPGSVAAGSRLWADPRRRLVHPDLLVALAFERGCAEAEVVVPAAGPGGPADAYVLAARTPGAPPAG